MSVVATVKTKTTGTGAVIVKEAGVAVMGSGGDTQQVVP